MMRRLDGRVRRGFTLLEMLLALAVLSMVGVLVATMLAQASDMTKDNERRDATLDITRVVRLMTEQWEDRRSAAPIGKHGETYGAGPDEIVFVTARPILNPEWPLAVVRYRVELIGASVVEAERRYDIVYEERPVAALGEEARERNGDERAWASAEKIVLLKNCTEVRMERFRSAEDAVLEELGPSAQEEALAESETGAAGAERGGRRVSGGMNEEALAERRAALLRAARASWVVFDKEVARTPAAVRVSGKYEGEAFACVFVGAVSR